MISISKTEEILRGMRTLESGENMTVQELAEFLAKLKVLQDQIERSEEVAKKILLKKDIKSTYYFPEIEKKVLLSEGKTKTEYPVQSVLTALKNAGKGEVFVEIVKVQQNLLETQPEDVKSLVNALSKSAVGNPFIVVAKMNKQELVEQASK